MRFPDYEHSTQTNTPPEADTATVEQILEAYNKGNLDTLLNVLARRPRELAQQLNRICRAFPAEVERVATVLQQVGDQLPAETLVRLHNQYANAARGVGERLSMDNLRMVHLIQTPVITRSHAARLLLAIEMCLVGRMEGFSVEMPPQDYYRPMEAEPAPTSCNPALDGAINPFTPALWEPFRLGGSDEAVALSATGVREVPDGYELSVLLLDDDYARVKTIERGVEDTCFSCFWDEEGVDSENDIRCGLTLGYRIEEYAEVNVHRAMALGVRYVVVTARVGERFPQLGSADNPGKAPQGSPVHPDTPRFTSQVAPDIRSLMITPEATIRPVDHRGNFHVLDAPGRTVCAVLDLYKQRISTPAVGIPEGADEDTTLTAIMGVLNEYLPMTVREFMRLSGAAVRKPD